MFWPNKYKNDSNLLILRQTHRVGRVLSFFSSRGIGTPPTPHPPASVPPHPGTGGGAHSLAREGLGESQFRRGDIHCGTLYIYVLCGQTAYIESFLPIGWHTLLWCKNPPKCCTILVWIAGCWNSSIILLMSRNPKNNCWLFHIFRDRFGGKIAVCAHKTRVFF